MKNKFLFNRIRVEEDGRVKFCPFRSVSFTESFSAYTKLTANHERWEFSPSTYKEFLSFLKKTKLSDSGEYNITLCVDGREEKYLFHSLVDYYASKIYMNSPFMHLSTVGRFTTQAYKIKEETAELMKAEKNNAETEIEY